MSQRCCPNQQTQEGVCGWPCHTPGMRLLLPPQRLFHLTGNEEAAELCPSSTAGESVGPAVLGMSFAREQTVLGSWQGPCWGCIMVGMCLHSVEGMKGGWGRWVRASLLSGIA